jgi:hypothetical protein
LRAGRVSLKFAGRAYAPASGNHVATYLSLMEADNSIEQREKQSVEELRKAVSSEGCYKVTMRLQPAREAHALRIVSVLQHNVFEKYASSSWPKSYYDHENKG